MKRAILLSALLILTTVTGKSEGRRPSIYKADDKVTTTIGGRFLMDAAGYLNNTDTLNNQANITDLRLTAKATYKDWFMRIDVGFDGNHLGMKDTFLQYSKNGNYFRFGHMLNSFGIDPAVSTYDYQFINCANSTSLLYFGRHVGFAYIHSAKKYYLAANAFAGDQIGHIKSNFYQGYNVSGRAVYRPINEEGRQLQFGASVLYRKPDMDKETGISNITLGGTGVTGLASPDYQRLVLNDAKGQSQFNLEFMLIYDKWMAQGEFLATGINRLEKNLPQYQAHGGYFQAGYMILGKGYGYDYSEAVPTAPLEAKSLQLIARYNYSNLNHEKSGLYGGLQKDLSVGLTYQFNKHINSRLIYSWINLDDHSPLGARNVHMIQARIAFWL